MACKSSLHLPALFKNICASAMDNLEKELHKQVEQQRIILKKLIDKLMRNTEKMQNPKQENSNKESNLNIDK